MCSQKLNFFSLTISPPTVLVLWIMQTEANDVEH